MELNEIEVRLNRPNADWLECLSSSSRISGVFASCTRNGSSADNNPSVSPHSSAFDATRVPTGVASHGCVSTGAYGREERERQGTS